MTILSAGLSLAKSTSTLPKRFAAKCAEPSSNGCIEWLGEKTRGGYGVLRPGGLASGKTTAHRIAWVLKRGAIAPEILVLHRCDNPSCVNVDHLFLGSPKANVRDMMAKGRHGWRNGTPWQKLHATDAERISDLRGAGLTQQKIADWMSVSRALVSLVLAGKIHYASPLGSSDHR